MDNTSGKWLKIARADTRGRILDFSDPNPGGVGDGKYAPKIALNLCLYEGPEHKASLQHTHFVDTDTLSLLAWDILTQRRGTADNKGAIFSEFKGGPGPARSLISRRLSVSYNDNLNIGPVYQFRFVVSEGVEGPNGQISPKPGATPTIDQTFNMSVQTAREIALTLLQYLQAQVVVRLLRGS